VPIRASSALAFSRVAKASSSSSRISRPIRLPSTAPAGFSSSRKSGTACFAAATSV
jgi:hypothetical protein